MRGEAFAQAAAAERLARRLELWLAGHAGAGSVVGAYCPMQSEPDLTAAFSGWRAACGGGLALPVNDDREGGMHYVAWEPGQPLVKNPFGGRNPPPGRPEVLPGVIVAPCLAAHPAGWRLGYGRGAFDRWIAAHSSPRPACVAVAFEATIVQDDFSCALDARFDWIVTDARTIRTQ
ncbi:MAG: hypothetical protein HUK26_00665 [Duodenibacillus sp.]|nr:hypothetical protein [Duodenibacillus sp.]